MEKPLKGLGQRSTMLAFGGASESELRSQDASGSCARAVRGWSGAGRSLTLGTCADDVNVALEGAKGTADLVRFVTASHRRNNLINFVEVRLIQGVTMIT